MLESSTRCRKPFVQCNCTQSPSIRTRPCAGMQFIASSCERGACNSTSIIRSMLLLHTRYRQNGTKNEGNKKPGWFTGLVWVPNGRLSSPRAVERNDQFGLATRDAATCSNFGRVTAFVGEPDRLRIGRRGIRSSRCLRGIQTDSVFERGNTATQQIQLGLQHLQMVGLAALIAQTAATEPPDDPCHQQQQHSADQPAVVDPHRIHLCTPSKDSCFRRQRHLSKTSFQSNRGQHP